MIFAFATKNFIRANPGIDRPKFCFERESGQTQLLTSRRLPFGMVSFRNTDRHNTTRLTRADRPYGHIKHFG